MRVYLYIISICLLSSCSDQKDDRELFTVLGADQTGLDFSNDIKPTPAFNLFSYMYFYNGSGLGAGDFNQDGLTDLFFASNQKGCKLYLNRGEMRFEDVSKDAGILPDSSWTTGVSIVDINADGLLDIYLCKVGRFKILQARNQLYVCKGVDARGTPQFTEEAAAYGLDFSGFSTHAAFLDHDGDGDLDMFLLNHSVNHDGNYKPKGYFAGTFDSLAGQRFYLNESRSNKDGSLQVRFRDVSRQVGIFSTRIGYGLGVAVSDVNLDGWPDIYIGNDFHEDDYLYINQKDGTFREEGRKRLRHTSQFSMGVDAADLNNDGFPEIVSMDMLPYDPQLLRRSLSEDDYNIYQQKIAYGYTHQYARNNLQYNRGGGSFSEVGQYAGIHATDWSWASLLMDFDNDCKRDLFVSNGIPKRMNDIDYINFVSGEEMQKKLQQNAVEDKDLSLISRFPEIKIPNRFFLNKGEFSFEDVTADIGANPNTFSNGAVYADLDNDGDLDIAVNNINDPALIYRNNACDLSGRPRSFARIRLKGPASNPSAIGASIVIFSGRETHIVECQPVHGFQSSMLAPLHIGLEGVKADSSFLIWPDRTFQSVALLRDTLNTFIYQPGLPAFDYRILHDRFRATQAPVFEDITVQTGLLHLHQENRFNEFDREPLMPQMVSTEGPALAVADINSDGLDDLFVGASKTFRNEVYLQYPEGRFTRMPQPSLASDSMWENTDALWLDVDSDQDPDLIVANGGNEYYDGDIHMSPLLYVNMGNGRLQKKEDAFSDIMSTQSRVIAIDLDQDNDQDLFIAGRAEPWKYGIAPRSYLLENDGTGKFRDVTRQFSEELLRPGMVTDVAYADMDGDQKKDLVLCYDWGSIDVFFAREDRFEKKRITSKRGMWHALCVADVDADGDLDIVAGNMGLNARLKASADRPVRLYINDFDDNGRTEQLMTYYVGGKEIPFASKVLLEKSLPVLKKKYLYAEAFSKADVEDLFGRTKLNESVQLTVNDFSSVILWNEGGGKFRSAMLPFEAQLGPIRAITVCQADVDPYPDLMLWGNFHSSNIEIGRQDALKGLIMLNPGKGFLNARPMTNLRIDGQVSQVRKIRLQRTDAFVLGMNSDSLRVIRPAISK